MTGPRIDDIVRRIVREELGGEGGEAGQTIPPAERLTPEMVSMLNRAIREALQLGQNKIGPEHMLLAIVRGEVGLAFDALVDVAGDSRAVRRAVIARMSAGYQS